MFYFICYPIFRYFLFHILCDVISILYSTLNSILYLIRNSILYSNSIFYFEDAGVGLKALRLIRIFWDKGILVCRASGYHGSPFSAERGVTQVGPLSPTIFNIMVDAIVQEWMRQMELAGFNVTDIRTIVAVFYADNRLVAARDPKTL